MGLLRRLATIAAAVALCIALTSLPTLRPHRITGSAFVPAAAWAGGSPDETLKPPPPPLSKSRQYLVQVRPSAERNDVRADRLTTVERWLLLYRVYLASVLRI